MFSKPLAFGLLALGCVTAAAGGAYVATRHNAVELPASAPAATAPVASSPAADVAPKPADQGVTETEAVVTPRTADPAPREDTTPRGTAAKEITARKAAAESHTPKPSEAKARPAPASAPTSKATTPAVQDQPARTVPLPKRTATPQPSASVADTTPAPVSILPSAASAEPTTGSDSAEGRRRERFDELVLPAASVIGLQLETGLTSERAHVEDRVEARVTRDVLVDGRLAIPAGSRVLGSVTQVDRGGKLKERARLSIRFYTLVLGNGDEVSLRTEPITRDGEPPAADSSKKIGGAAVGGAILGAILGGGKGAMIGGMAGAGGGTAMVMAGDRNPATFQPGTIVTARLASPVTVQVRRDQ